MATVEQSPPPRWMIDDEGAIMKRMSSFGMFSSSVVKLHYQVPKSLYFPLSVVSF